MVCLWHFGSGKIFVEQIFESSLQGEATYISTISRAVSLRTMHTYHATVKQREKEQEWRDVDILLSST